MNDHTSAYHPEDINSQLVHAQNIYVPFNYCLTSVKTVYIQPPATNVLLRIHRPLAFDNFGGSTEITVGAFSVSTSTFFKAWN